MSRFTEYLDALEGVLREARARVLDDRGANTPDPQHHMEPLPHGV
jgi:hypothetical protein